MTLKPHTWRRSSPRLAAVLSCSTLITTIGIALSAAWLTLLFLTHDYDSSPPFMVAFATATALTWIWRMHLARAAAEKAHAEAEHRADEALIEAIRRQRPGDEDRLREEEAFHQITQLFKEERKTNGLD